MRSLGCSRRRATIGKPSRNIEQEYYDVLAAQQRGLGAEHPDTLATRYEIAGMLAARGHYREAEQEYGDVLAAQLQVLGADHPRTNSTRDALTALQTADRDGSTALKDVH
jgi:hypothetical protein